MKFLPEGYEVPKPQGGNYMKLNEGANKFRILSQAVVGYEYWTAGNKPVRLREYPKSAPADIRADSKVKHFWAFAVWNYAAEAVQLLELTQATIQNAITNFIIMDEFGEPTGYDIVVTRKGEGLETEYITQALPPKAVAGSVTKAYEDLKINLEALFDGGNPFEAADDVSIDKAMGDAK